MSIHIVTDSTAYLDEEFVRNHGITVVPLTFFFEGKTYEEPMPGHFDWVYERIRDGAEIPKSSQPSLQAFADAFEGALKKATHVIGVFISSGVSGTYSCACAAAKAFGTDRIALIDTRKGACAARIMIENIIRRVSQGSYFKQIVDQCVADVSRLRIEIAPKNLEYLKRSGRLSGAAAFVGNLLSVCPILEIDGTVNMKEKVRGQKRALDIILSRIPENCGRIGILHALNLELAVSVFDKAKSLFPKAAVTIEEVGPVVGSNVGPGTVGVCYETAGAN